jgi:hypothetical protein
MKVEIFHHGERGNDGGKANSGRFVPFASSAPSVVTRCRVTAGRQTTRRPLTNRTRNSTMAITSST